MKLDPANPVVLLCVHGMEAEQNGELARARELFEQAWSERTSDVEACIAAHYLARHQPDAQASLRWNLEALRLADAAASEGVEGFLPSLHLNLASSYEQLADRAAAQAHLSSAEALLDVLEEDSYKEQVRHGIANVRARLERARSEAS